jgi:hypothetical protein
MVKIVQLLSVIFFSTSLSSLAQELTVKASTDTSSYLVGDYITYTLEIRHDKYFAVYIPSIKDSIKVLDFIRALPVEKKYVGENVVEYHKFIFSKYDSGSVTIPPVQIAYTKYQSGNKLFMAANSVSIDVHTFPVNTQEDIKDVKEPIKLPLDWLMIIIIVLLITGFMIGSYYLYKHYKKKKESVVDTIPEVKIPPHEAALNQLHLLEEKELWQKGMIKEYHSEITEIIRKYFEERFDFKALEITTSEIMTILSYMEESKVVVNTASKFFNNADLVKFAKFQPIPSVNQEMMRQAFQIVNDTIPKPTETEDVHNVQ